MTTRIGLIADDLTGAGDTAVQFVRAGWETELQLSSRPSRAAVIAVTTDSRNLSAVDAANRVSDAITTLRESGITNLYKKIDSTLRGNVRAEVDAALRAWGPDATAVICPAFPSSGRTVRHGNLLLEGVPVSQTGFRNDPVTPVLESHIPTLVGAAEAIVRNPGEDSTAFAARLQRHGRIVVVDAANDDDLLFLAQSIATLDRTAIAVGSPGLARHLANTWRASPAPPAIVIVTSQQDLARRQAAAVEAQGAMRFEPEAGDLLDDRAWARASAKVLDQLDESPASLLLLATRDRTQNLPASLIPQRLAELAARAVAHRPRGSIAGFVVTGGDGARALVDALAATGIALRDEIISGIPLGTLIGGKADGLPIVTKAGGFGPEDALVRSIQAVRDRKHI